MSGEVEKCPILHVRPKFDVFTLETFFSNFNLDRLEALSAATLYSRHLAETTSRMNKANGLSTNCFGDETQHFFSLQQTN